MTNKERSSSILKTEHIYDGKIINLRVDTVELPDKKYAKREIVGHKNGVCIIPVADDGQIYMVEQYRIAANKNMLELPAGIVDDGEDPKEAAMRELREETGMASKKLNFLFDAFSSPGFCTEKINFFLAEDLYQDPLPQDEDEFLTLSKHSLEDLFNMIEACEIDDAKTIIGILYCKIKGKNE